MGKKAEVGTPKWLANKMKSKGLQKLRWYCQMCQKQCRDQNGFKCHIQSESHQRQLLIFANNPNRFLSDYSREFESCFLNLLKRSHGTKRVKANRVYQEYIRDKEHVHMNSTRWETLTGFIMYLGRTGKCVVDNTEEGWFISWIDRDPDTIARQEALEKRKKLDKDDNERMAEFIETQVARAKEKEEDSPQVEYSELVRESEEEKLQLELKINEKKVLESKTTPILSKSVFKEIEFKEPKKRPKSESEDKEKKRKKTALEEIIEEEQLKKKHSRSSSTEKGKIEEGNKKSAVKDYWLKKGIVVKIVTKSLGEKFYKQKGYVKEVIDKYAGVVVLLSSGTKIKLDQEHLETVIPCEGKSVLIVNGKHRGLEGTLKGIDQDNFEAEIKLVDTGETVRLPYEHFSKIHVLDK